MSAPAELDGRVAFITGAAHGQGRAVALALAASGADIVAFDVAAKIEYPAYSQGSTAELDSLPNVLEAYITSGNADVVCKIAATSHEDLKDTLLHITQSPSVARSTSAIVLSELVPPRVLPMLRKGATAGPSRSPAFTTR